MESIYIGLLLEVKVGFKFAWLYLILFNCEKNNIEQFRAKSVQKTFREKQSSGIGVKFVVKLKAIVLRVLI